MVLLKLLQTLIFLWWWLTATRISQIRFKPPFSAFTVHAGADKSKTSFRSLSTSFKPRKHHVRTRKYVGPNSGGYPPCPSTYQISLTTLQPELTIYILSVYLWSVQVPLGSWYILTPTTLSCDSHFHCLYIFKVTSILQAEMSTVVWVLDNHWSRGVQ